MILSLLSSPKALMALGIVLALTASHAVVGTKAYSVGSRAEAARWQADKIKDQAAAADRLQAALAAQQAEQAKREQSLQEGADDIAQIKVVQLPGRVEIKRLIVEKPVYRDCVVDQRVFSIVNAARAGRPVTEDALRSPGDGVPADAAARL